MRESEVFPQGPALADAVTRVVPLKPGSDSEVLENASAKARPYGERESDGNVIPCFAGADFDHLS